tara:strand:- start:316 stop:930 length:615 start_codon:yes stop_codon:yes gene_type:complete
MLSPEMKQVTCRVCGVAGKVRIRASSLSGDRHRIDDHIEHAEKCTLYRRPQPRHLKKKLAWERQEKHANSLVGAHATVASGALNEDGDGRVFGEWRVESKQTKRTAYALYQTVWSKLVNGAVKAGEEPLLHVQMNGKKRVVVRRRWFEEHDTDETLVHVNDRLKNKKSYKVDSAESTPHLIQLEPEGVLLYESEFQKLKGEETT